MSDKVNTKQRVIALYAMGEEALDVRLRALGTYLGVEEEHISDIMSLVHALSQRGVARLRHSLFVDCLWIMARVKNYEPKLTHTKIMDATNTVLGMQIRPRAVWLKDNLDMVCFIYGCSREDIPSLTRKGRTW